MPGQPPIVSLGLGLLLAAAPALAQSDGGSSGDPLDAPPTCTSATYWTKGTRPSPDMEPGRACIACHSVNNGPLFTVAGTVYPTGHEPDDCYGTAAAGAVVTVRDSTGKEFSFTANSPAGNFFGSPTLVFPITARVTVGGSEVRSLGPGDHFGEIALIADTPRTATITADTELTCWGVTAWHFRPLVEQNSSLAWKMLQGLARQLAAGG